MKKQIVIAFLFAVGVAGFFACQKNDLNVNGTSEYGVQFKGLNSDFSLPVSGSLKSTFVEPDSVSWDSAHLVVSTIKFEAELKSMVTNRDSLSIEYKWRGRELIDLLNNEITLGNFVLSPGMYDEIELKVEGLKMDAGNDPVFYLEGTYKNSAGSWPVVVNVSENVYFKTEKENVEVGNEGVDITSVIELYLDQLMTDVDPADLDNAEQTEGVIIISKESNTAIYEIIVRNLAHDRHSYYKHRHHGDEHDHKGYNDDHNDNHGYDGDHDDQGEDD